jgi:F0F1-type ATP synthase epsilon subunit
MKRPLLDVKVFWVPVEKEVFFEGKAVSVSSENPIGPFDVLPLHANFVTLIYKKLTIVTPRKEKIEYEFKKGVLEVRENKVTVFLGF